MLSSGLHAINTDTFSHVPNMHTLNSVVMLGSDSNCWSAENRFYLQNYVGSYNYQFWTGEESRSTRWKTPDDRSDYGSGHLQERKFSPRPWWGSNPRPCSMTVLATSEFCSLSYPLYHRPPRWSRIVFRKLEVDNILSFIVNLATIKTIYPVLDMFFFVWKWG